MRRTFLNVTLGFLLVFWLHTGAVDQCSCKVWVWNRTRLYQDNSARGQHSPFGQCQIVGKVGSCKTLCNLLDEALKDFPRWTRPRRPRDTILGLHFLRKRLTSFMIEWTETVLFFNLPLSIVVSTSARTGSTGRHLSVFWQWPPRPRPYFSSQAYSLPKHWRNSAKVISAFKRLFSWRAVRHKKARLYFKR